MDLVEQATANAVANGLEARVKFICADLTRDPAALMKQLGAFDAVLIDPPREGAYDVVRGLSQLPRRIVYVSCNPATLSRDAGELVHNKGYRLEAAGVINMFPHTSHIESIAVFSVGQ
jgi:23S rRNA (uracil1939-C5)-methyltransferase